jgi:PAS domain S-box-containing protein
MIQKGKFVYVSSIYEKLTGYAAADLTGKNFLDHVHPDDRALIKKNAARNLKKKNPDTYEYRFVRKNGDIMWVLETISSGIHQGAQALLGSIMDITRYKQTEDAIGLKEERYHTLLEETEENYYEIDLKGNFAFVNDAMARHMGYSREELIGMNYRQYCDAETAQKMLELYTHVYQSGKPFMGIEVPFIIKGGAIRFVEISGAPIRDKQGKPAGFRGVSRDITERKRMEENLRVSEERYRTILEDMDEGYFEVDLRGSFTFVNDAECRDLGYSREELIGINYRQYCGDEEAAKGLFEQFNTIYKTGCPSRGISWEFISKDGKRHFNEVSASLIRDAKGKPVGFRGISRDITKRKQEEEERKQDAERYRTILEEINEGCSEFDLTGTWTFTNEAAANILGYTPAELIGKNYKEVTDEDSGRKLFHAFNGLYQTGRPFRGLEAEFLTKQGIRRVNEISGALLRDEKGQPVGFRALARDITERKWAEDALLQSEARYFSIIESIGDAYFETDLTGMTTFVNDRACEDLGYTREELLHMSNRDLQDEASAQETYAVFNEVYETGRPFREFQYKVNRKDGTTAIFEMAVSLMRDADGKPIGFRGLSRDITERKKMEDALKASEARARTLIATIPDPYVERDLQGKAVYVNDAYVKLSGYNSEELRNMPYSGYLDAKNAEIVSNTYQTVLQTGLMMKNVEIDIITKKRETRRVNLSASLILDSQGNPTGFQSIIRDITDVKKAQELIKQSEQSLREYSETLESRVKQRTAELEKAKIAAEAANRAKSDFMANISHEFQTPLNAVIGFTKVLQDRMFGELSEKQEEFVRFIAEAGASLSRIITEILDASHASSGTIKLNFSSVSIVNALSQTTRLLALQIEEKKQILTVDVDLDADVSIEADEQKIQQALFHLMSNAVKYTDEGGKIDIKAARTSHPVSRQECVSIAIADTGIGIKAEDMSKLFQAFVTLESPYSKTGAGIGVGLSLTKQLVELHGGTVSVESKFGQGSCFTVFLPLRQQQAGSPE